MIAYPSIDPVAVALGPVKVHWYGLMYLLAFASAWWLGKRRARQEWSPVRPEQIDDLVFYGALGAVIGGRIGSVIFYNFDSFLQNPLYLFKIWEGGMSFHGGFIGVLLAMWFYRRKLGCGFFELTDFIAQKGGEVAGIFVVVNRSGKKTIGDYPVVSCMEVEFPIYPPDEVPDWLSEIPAVRPGTKKVE